MGSWGYGPFDSDDALSERVRVRDHIEAKLRSALQSPPDDEKALAYVEMLLRMRSQPSSDQFGADVETKMIANFNAPTKLHRRVPRTSDGRISVLVEGRRGDIWDDPAKRLAVIKRTVRRWRQLARITGGPL